jgi:hypothetical protein
LNPIFNTQPLIYGFECAICGRFQTICSKMFV